MKNDFNYRHELKYEINESQLIILKERLSSLLEYDKHTDTNGSYVVRSVYFDDYKNSCYNDNEDGNDNRKKFRIRTYNNSDSVIKLELKHKNVGLTRKESCTISRDMTVQLINKEKPLWNDNCPPLLKRLLVARDTVILSPKIIVEYDRVPFYCYDGNTRITLDQNIRTTADVSRFFESGLAFRPVMPTGYHLLEVKFDRFIPDYIMKNIASLGLRQTTFSKYYYCRKFGGLL